MASCATIIDMKHQRIKKIALCASLAAAVLFILLRPNWLGGAAAQLLHSAASALPPRHDSPQAITLQAGDFVLFGQHLNQPILWETIEINDGRPLLFSAYVIGFRAFSTAEHERKLSSCWESSDMRAWLNHDFLQLEYRALIDGDIQLPSTTMLRQIPAAQRRRRPTRAAVVYEYSPWLHLRRYAWYWTMDAWPTNEQSVRAVTTRGTFYQSRANDAFNGVAPVLYLAAAQLQSAGGDGSRATPFVLTGGAP